MTMTLIVMIEWPAPHGWEYRACSPALSPETARDLLTKIYEDPAGPPEHAERLDMTLQRVSYRLEKLEEAELLRVAVIRYSEKTQEMKIYPPTDDPLVVCVGTEERKSSFTDNLKRLIPATAILAVVSYDIQESSNARVPRSMELVPEVSQYQSS